MGGLPKPPTLVVVVAARAGAGARTVLYVVLVNEPFRLGGLLQSVDDDTELLGDVLQATGPAHVVGDATGDLELVRGGGGGGIRLFCRSGVRSGTGGLPVSDDVLLNRRSTGFGATGAAVTVVNAAVPVTVVNAAAVPAVTAAAAVIDGAV